MVNLPLGRSTDEFLYADTGCVAAPSCLTCPLPQCRHDDPIGYMTWKRQRKDKLVVATMAQEGLTFEETAERFSVTVRTVFRIRRRVVREQATSFGKVA